MARRKSNEPRLFEVEGAPVVPCWDWEERAWASPG
jgi:hypothetical protein